MLKKTYAFVIVGIIAIAVAIFLYNRMHFFSSAQPGRCFYSETQKQRVCLYWVNRSINCSAGSRIAISEPQTTSITAHLRSLTNGYI